MYRPFRSFYPSLRLKHLCQFPSLGRRLLSGLPYTPTELDIATPHRIPLIRGIWEQAANGAPVSTPLRPEVVRG